MDGVLVHRFGMGVAVAEDGGLRLRLAWNFGEGSIARRRAGAEAGKQPDDVSRCLAATTRFDDARGVVSSARDPTGSSGVILQPSRIPIPQAPGKTASDASTALHRPRRPACWLPLSLAVQQAPAARPGPKNAGVHMPHAWPSIELVHRGTAGATRRTCGTADTRLPRAGGGPDDQLPPYSVWLPDTLRYSLTYYPRVPAEYVGRPFPAPIPYLVS